MRPKDSDRVILTVEPQRKFIEPDSPNSMDQLIGPQSPDIDDSLCVSEYGSGKGHFKRVFDYDNRINEELSEDYDEKGPLSKQACSAAVIHHAESSCKPIADNSPEGAVGGQYPGFGGSCIDYSKVTPSKINIFSQNTDIARYRPSPKHPVTCKSSPLVLAKSSTEKNAHNVPLCPETPPDKTASANPCSLNSQDQTSTCTYENYENIPIVRKNKLQNSGDTQAQYLRELHEADDQMEREQLLSMDSVI